MSRSTWFDVDLNTLPLSFFRPVRLNPSRVEVSISGFDVPAQLQQSKPKLKPYEERKGDMIQKLHSLPLKVFYSRESLMNWSVPRLQKELKKNHLKPTILLQNGRKTEKEQLVDQLYALNLKEGEAGSCSETCSICCLDYEDEEVLRSLACKHVFHVECVDRWAITSTAKSRPPKCPACNREI